MNFSLKSIPIDEKLHEVLDFLRTQDNISGEEQLVIQTIQNFETLSLDEIIDSVRKKDDLRSLRFLMQAKLFERIVPDARNTFDDIIGPLSRDEDDSNDIGDTFENKFRERIEGSGIVMKVLREKFVGNYVVVVDEDNDFVMRFDLPPRNWYVLCVNEYRQQFDVPQDTNVKFTSVRTNFILKKNDARDVRGKKIRVSVEASRLITVKVVERCGKESSFRIQTSTKMKKLINAYGKQKGLTDVRFLFCGEHFDPEDTAYDLEMEDGDIIDNVVSQCGGKPVILIYPKSETKIDSVSVSLNKNRWGLSSVYPKNCVVSPDKQYVRWQNMTAKPNGEIVLHGNERTFRYLFWESKNHENFQFDFDMNEKMYLVKREEICRFVESVLHSKKMKTHDIDNFVTFWLKELERHEFTVIQFMKTDEYEQNVTLKVVPEPDCTIKIFMLFVGFNNLDKVDTNRFERNLENIEDEREKVELLSEKKMVIYEWGGMNLVKSRLLSK